MRKLLLLYLVMIFNAAASLLAQAGDEVRGLGRSRALVLSTPHQRAEAEALAGRLGPLAAGVFPRAAMHTPVEVTEVCPVREVRRACGL